MNPEPKATKNHRIIFVLRSGATHEIVVRGDDRAAEMYNRFISYLAGEAGAKSYYSNMLPPASLFVIRWDEVQSFYSLPK